MILNTKLFGAMETNTVTVMVDMLRRAPVLLFDDWGIEYGQASGKSDSFGKAKIRMVINNRYSLLQERPIVVTSNLTPQQLIKRDIRLGSRLRDHRRVKAIHLSGFGDYRIKNSGRLE